MTERTTDIPQKPIDFFFHFFKNTKVRLTEYEDRTLNFAFDVAYVSIANIMDQGIRNEDKLKKALDDKINFISLEYGVPKLLLKAYVLLRADEKQCNTENLDEMMLTQGFIDKLSASLNEFILKPTSIENKNPELTSDSTIKQFPQHKYYLRRKPKDEPLNEEEMERITELFEKREGSLSLHYISGILHISEPRIKMHLKELRKKRAILKNG